jgi:hypothetical protein
MAQIKKIIFRIPLLQYKVFISRVVDPDPHYLGDLDPHPDPHTHQIKIHTRIRINLQMSSQTVWNMSLF